MVNQNDIVADGDTCYRIVAALGSTMYLQKAVTPVSGNHSYAMEQVKGKYKIEYVKEK